MAVSSSTVKHYQSAAHPDDDSAAAGGSISSPLVEVTGSTKGEVLTRLRAAASGVIDDDAVVEYQISYWLNSHATDSLANAAIYINNMIDALSGTVAIDLVSTSASDGSTKHVKLWGKDGSGDLVSEEVTLNGTTTVTSIQAFAELYRAELRLNSDGSTQDAAGVISIKETGSTTKGIIPQGRSHATREVAMALAASKGNVSALTNRVTEPSVTWAYPRTLSSALAVPGGELAAGEKIAMYWRLKLQPGMPSADLDVDMILDGDP